MQLYVTVVRVTHSLIREIVHKLVPQHSMEISLIILANLVVLVVQAVVDHRVTNVLNVKMVTI